MSWTRVVRSELRKLTTTRMPWAFIAVLVVLAAMNALAVAFGTDMDGSKAFIAIVAWALVPAAVGLWSVQRRDVI